MPLTENKKDAIAERLEKPLVFIKRNYVLKNISMKNKRLNELHTEYLSDPKGYTKLTNISFNKVIKQCDLNDYCKDWNKTPTMSIDHEKLKEIFIKNSWIHPTDYTGNEEEDDDLNQYNLNKDSVIIQGLRREVEELKRKLSQYEKSEPKQEEQTEEELEQELETMRKDKEQLIKTIVGSFKDL